MKQHALDLEEWEKHVRPLCFRGITKEQYEWSVGQGKVWATECLGDFIGQRAVSIKLLQDVHQLIFWDVYPSAGQIRTEEQSIGKIELASPPAGIARDFQTVNEHLSKWLNVNIHEIKDLNERADAFEKRAEALAAYHIALLQVQPFRDGNGRVCSLITEHQAARAFGKQCTEIGTDQDLYQKARAEGLINHNLKLMTELIMDSAGIRDEIATLRDQHRQMITDEQNTKALREHQDFKRLTQPDAQSCASKSQTQSR